MFDKLEEINTRPAPFEYYTADELWTDKHTSQKMLSYHLDGTVDISSRQTGFIDRSVEWISSKFCITPGFRIADFGCGPGLYASRLARKGAQVTGIDFSARSIEYAKDAACKEGLEVEFINTNYLDYETEEQFDLIAMIMCDFCALSPTQRKTMLRKFHRFLTPGGSILLDAYSLKAFEKKKETAIYEKNMLDHFWSAEDSYCFLNTFRYEPEKVILDKYVIIEPGKTRTVYNWLQYFIPDSLKAELASCGFDEVHFYQDVCGSAFDPNSDEFAITATKQ